MRSTTALTTAYDAVTRQGVSNIIDYVESMGVELTFHNAIDLVDGTPPKLIDIAEYAVDALNDECPAGVYYYLTADMNVACDDER